jgi:hypothetical protein
LRAIACHASRARGADAACSAGDQRMDTVQSISHLNLP